MDEHAVVSAQEWVSARKALLAKEKEFTRRRDELARQRRELPWEAVTKEYFFEGADGTRSLPQLFDGRSQLIVYHFMFPPEWDEGCPHCSFWADNFNGTMEHLHARDVTMAAVSRAPITKLTAYQKRMGWTFPWYSTPSIDFNHDYHVTFTQEELADGTAVYNYGATEPGFSDREGVSVFYADPGGRVFHTYSAYARGIDLLNGAYNYIDLVPKGRDEAGHDNPQFWVRRHDEYGS
ncbi:MAG TPA: thioredoxin family protein [Streptosporangiaceae bacterium]|nr:thioredoxin family protein [Streptosporangiaceae bacterium]